MTDAKNEAASGASLSDAVLGAAKVQEYRDNGWVFKYDPETRFVGAYHPQGGKQSICELRNGFGDDAFGFAIAAHMNGTVPNIQIEGRD